MTPLRSAAVVLTILGILALAYGGFSYPRETQEAKIGSLSVSVQSQRSVNVPVWAGVGAIVLGVVLLLAPQKKT